MLAVFAYCIIAAGAERNLCLGQAFCRCGDRNGLPFHFWIGHLRIIDHGSIPESAKEHTDLPCAHIFTDLACILDTKLRIKQFLTVHALQCAQCFLDFRLYGTIGQLSVFLNPDVRVRTKRIKEAFHAAETAIKDILVHGQSVGVIGSISIRILFHERTCNREQLFHRRRCIQVQFFQPVSTHPQNISRQQSGADIRDGIQSAAECCRVQGKSAVCINGLPYQVRHVFFQDICHIHQLIILTHHTQLGR